jgi:hypothetical protein
LASNPAIRTYLPVGDFEGFEQHRTNELGLAGEVNGWDMAGLPLQHSFHLVDELVWRAGNAKGRPTKVVTKLGFEVLHIGYPNDV